MRKIQWFFLPKTIVQRFEKKINEKTKRMEKNRYKEKTIAIFHHQTHTHGIINQLRSEKLLSNARRNSVDKKFSCLQKGRYPTRVRTLDPQNRSPPSYQLRNKNYKQPFLTIDFIFYQSKHFRLRAIEITHKSKRKAWKT